MSMNQPPVKDIIEAALLSADEPCDMPALFSALQDRGARTIVYPMHEPWLDVGRPEDYAQAAANLPADESGHST